MNAKKTLNLATSDELIQGGNGMYRTEDLKWDTPEDYEPPVPFACFCGPNDKWEKWMIKRGKRPRRGWRRYK